LEDESGDALVTAIPSATSLDDLKRLAAVAAHEMGNSLAAIIATAQLLRASAHDPAVIARLADRIETIARQMVDAISDLKVLGATPRREHGVCLNELVREAAERVLPIAQKDGLRLELDLDPALPTLACDRRGVMRVLINLIKNALEAARGATTEPVVVRSRRRGPFASITVYNLGKPIPPGVREQIFKPFFSTKPHGSGLGLFISREIVVDGHNGAISFHSGPRLGTAFCVKLPLEG